MSLVLSRDPVMESVKFSNDSKIHSKKFWILPGTILILLKTAENRKKIPKLKIKLRKKVLVTVKPAISNIFSPESEISGIDIIKLIYYLVLNGLSISENFIKLLHDHSSVVPRNLFSSSQTHPRVGALARYNHRVSGIRQSKSFLNRFPAIQNSVKILR